MEGGGPSLGSVVSVPRRSALCGSPSGNANENEVGAGARSAAVRTGGRTPVGYGLIPAPLLGRSKMRHDVLDEENMVQSPAERRTRETRDLTSFSGGAGNESRSGRDQSPSSILADRWRRVRSRLQAELGEATFNSWFKQIELVGAEDGRVMLSVPTRFIRNWVVSHYADR